MQQPRKRKKKRHFFRKFVIFLILAACLCIFWTPARNFVKNFWDRTVVKTMAANVLVYEEIINEHTQMNGIPQFNTAIMAIMMQESKGVGTDPMQSSECPYNTQYDQSPGAIEDPEYSIEVGIAYFKDCLDEAGCVSPNDEARLLLALQGYNFGTGYIDWAMNQDGCYTPENASQYSEMMKEELGWDTYGNPNYAKQVLRYYDHLEDIL